MKVDTIEYDWKKLHNEKEELVSFLINQVFEISKTSIPYPKECSELSNNLIQVKSKLSKISELIKKSSELQDKVVTDIALITTENNKMKRKILELVGDID